MSVVQEPGVCYCSCHTTKGVMHCFPCCQQCPTCKRNISSRYEEHAEACKARFDALVAEAEARQSSS